MSIPHWIRATLNNEKLSFEEVYHSSAYTAQDLAEREHTSGHQVVKMVVAIADGHPYALVLPACRKIRVQRVREALDATSVRLASEGELRSLCNDCKLGAAPPLPHWPGIKILMDPSMKVPGDILFQAGTHSDGIKMKFDDWFSLVKPHVAAFSIDGEESTARSSYKLEEEAEGLWF